MSMRYISKAGLVPITESLGWTLCVCVCVCARTRMIAHVCVCTHMCACVGSGGRIQLCSGQAESFRLLLALHPPQIAICTAGLWLARAGWASPLHFSPAVLHGLCCGLLHRVLAGWRQLNPTVSLLCQFSPWDGTHQTKVTCSRRHSRPPGGKNTISVLPAVLGKYGSTLWQSIPWPHGQGSCKGEAATSVPYTDNRRPT